MGPVLVVEGDLLHLVRGPAQTEALIRPPGYHALKAVAHVPFALRLMLEALAGAPFTPEASARLREYRRLVQAVRGDLAGRFQPGPERARQERILDASLALLDDALAQGQLSSAQLTAFTEAMAPLLTANVAAAAGLQLACLDGAVTRWRATLGPLWPALQVVILGPHMPRDGEVTWQYFSRLLGQPREGGRIVYAEGLRTVAQALDLLATHRVDQAAATAFFKDPERMHRDLLADAATAWLDAHPSVAP